MAKLNKFEEEAVSIILYGSKTDVIKKIRIAEQKSKFIKSPKSKAFIKECVTKIKEDINKNNFKDSVIKAVQLKETVQILLEKEIPVYEIKLPDLEYIKSIVLSAIPGDTTETVYLDFAIPFYPVGTSKNEVSREMEKIARRLSELQRIVLNQILRNQKVNEGKWPLFTGDGSWESTMPITKNKVGKVALGRVAPFTVDTVGAPLEELRPEIEELLREINTIIPKWFGEVATPEAQQEALAGKKVYNEPDDEDEDEAPEVKDNWYELETEFDTDENEPSVADLQKASKRVEFMENRLRVALLKEKLEKLSGKKVLFEGEDKGSFKPGDKEKK